MQKQQARLRCNRNSDFVSEDEPSTPFEVFLIEKYLDVAEQLLLICGSQPIEQIEVPLKITLRGICLTPIQVRTELRPTNNVRITLVELVGGQLEYEPTPVLMTAGMNEKEITIRNNDRFSLVEITSVRGEARYAAEEGTCRAATLPPRGTCTIKVRRSEPGTRGRGNVSVAYRDPLEHTLNIPVEAL